MKRPAQVAGALRRLEQRTLALLLAYGLGKLAVTATALLAGLYVLDRLFEPPPPVRAVLALGALGVLAAQVWRRLLAPLRRRPDPRDLAALWERSHPHLRGLLATAVELPAAPPGTSTALLGLARAQAEQATRGLDPRRAAPAGRARRSALRGSGTLLLVLGLAARFPAEAEVFLARLLGGAVAWPSATTLVLLPPFVEGRAEAPAPLATSPGRFRLELANGTVVSVRVRADGLQPERVDALVAGERRPMRPLGGGEFVLRLPPLQGEVVLSFRGGDDDDGLPALLLAGGDAPQLRDWSVRVEPPAYLGLAPEESLLSEFRVPAGTVLQARFRTEPVAARAWARALDGGERELARDAMGRWLLTATAASSGEEVLALEGEDGFRAERAGILRWQALADRPPRASFLWPEENWLTVANGVLPLVVDATDDHGLAELALRPTEQDPEQLLSVGAGATSFRRLEVLPAPPLPADAVEGAPLRFRAVLRALDAAPPRGQEGTALSPWIEVLGEAAFEERLGQRMIRAREQVEGLLERTLPYLEDRAAEAGRQGPRRLQRDLEALQRHLERILLERIYAGLDPAAPALRDPLDRILAHGAPEAGQVVAALDAGLAAPIERTRLLLDLARAAGAARRGPAEALGRAIEEGGDPLPAARELHAQLESMLDILLAWEDFQSAVDLLRGLLDRQRALYLRTKEASAR